MAARRFTAGLALGATIAGCAVLADLEEHVVIEPGIADAAPDVLEEAAPPSCENAKTKAPRDEPCIVQEFFGAFASPKGDDNNPGSRDLPTRTITAAILKAGERRRVFVCEGEYPERLALAGGGSVSLYGGFSCDSWAYSESNAKPRVAPATGLPLRLDQLNVAIAIQDLAFVAPDATGADRSSIAAIVNQSAKVDFARVQWIAGAGQTGITPPAPTGNVIASSGLAGNAAVTNAAGTVPGLTKNCICPVSGESSGGYGGTNAFGGANGTATPAALVDTTYAADTGAAGGATCDLPARLGAPGLPGFGGKVATTLGTVTADGWVPALAGSGGLGTPGQGGGGGGGGPSSLTPSAGGGGGCGACGGAAGDPGGAGGSSIAIVIRQSAVTFTSCQLTATDGKGGGTGGAGGNTVTPGAGGPFVGVGCPGAGGGAGGGGGGGGGGAGGISAGMVFPRGGPIPLWDALPVTLDAAELPRVQLGNAGSGGQGGTGGIAVPHAGGHGARNGVNGAGGPPGVARAVVVTD